MSDYTLFCHNIPLECQSTAHKAPVITYVAIEATWVKMESVHQVLAFNCDYGQNPQRRLV